MVTTCFICGLRISNAEGYALSILNIGNGDKNEAALICKEYHKRKMERQTSIMVKLHQRKYVNNKLEELERRIETLEKNSFPFPPMPPPPPPPPQFTFNKNGHLEGCQCIRCFDLEGEKTRL